MLDMCDGIGRRVLRVEVLLWGFGFLFSGGR
jgi:hypothetical protein